MVFLRFRSKGPRLDFFWRLAGGAPLGPTSIAGSGAFQTLEA
jgi:hypothetical protein